MRGLANAEKRRTIFNEYRNCADILCLQETHSNKLEENQWRNLWGGRILFSHGETNARGVCICFKKGVFFNIQNVICDMFGRYIACDVSQEDGRKVSICNIYAPNNDNPAFFDSVNQNCASLSHERIMLGDFNLVLDEKLDKYGTEYNNKPKSKQFLTDLMEEYCLIDIWRARHQGTMRFSWKRFHPLQASRIDFALVSQGLDQEIENVMYFKGIKSDHDAMLLSVNLTRNERGPGYWKFNTRHLTNNKFLTILKR